MRRRAKLQQKLARTMLLILGAMAVTLIALLVSESVRSSRRSLAAIESHHREALLTKATLLADNHALALKGLVLDNAFLDVRSLIQRAVSSDSDVIYGIFTSAEGKVWAFAGPGASAGMPDPVAYARLGLTAAQLLVDERTIREADVFGERVLEIAMPVKDGTENLGTIRYGLSPRRTYEALAVARQESRRDIVRSLALSIGVALCAAILAGLVSRRAADRIAKPITTLASAAKALSAGDRGVRVDIRSNDEVEELGDAFNQMVADLKTSYDSLEDLNRNLERKVESRTRELAARNRDMRLVLDNVEEGFLTLSPDGIMSAEHSSILETWFGPYQKDTTLGGYVEPTSPSFATLFRLGWEAIVEAFLPLELCVDQMPRRIEANGNTWHVRWLPILDGEKLEGMLVVIQDVTVALYREEEEQIQRDTLKAFQSLMRDRAWFIAFHAEITQMVNAVSSGQYDGDLQTLRRVIHTIKGNVSIFGLEGIARLVHRIEDGMAETMGLPAESGLRRLRSAWQLLSDNVMPAGSSAAPRALQVARADVDLLVASLRAIPSARHLAGQVAAWKLEPIDVPLRRLAEQASGLAKRRGKGDIEVDVRAEAIRCDADRWAPFWSDAVHIVRNAIDHGLESPEEREALGKPRGAVRFEAVREGADVVVSISDDGRGVPFDLIRAKAERLGLPHASPEDLLAALFTDGVSTAEAVSDVSGRGVGMGAVRSRVAALGGSIALRSSPGAGTTWAFRFHADDVAPASLSASVSSSPSAR